MTPLEHINILMDVNLAEILLKENSFSIGSIHGRNYIKVNEGNDDSFKSSFWGPKCFRLI